MTIRARFTLWYAGVLFASLVLFSALLYHEWRGDAQAAATPGAVPEEGTVADLAEDLSLSAIPAALLGLAGGWWLMRRALAPVAALTAAAERVNEGSLRTQLPRTGSGDELDRLTEVFNQMTARLADSFQRTREFTLRASHELKTPLTVLRGGCETTLREQTLTAEQRENLLGEIDEIDRLAKIVDGLTLLTKADAGLIVLKDEPVPLDALVRDACADGEILAQPHGIRLSLDHCDEATVRGDHHRLRQVLLNLTDNAVKYNHPGGTVTLALRRHRDTAELTIANTGPGILPAQQARLFEPFFRGDTAPDHTVEGSGLGLTICRWIVTAHRGTLTISSNPGGLTTATVRLPLAEMGRLEP